MSLMHSIRLNWVELESKNLNPTERMKIRRHVIRLREELTALLLRLNELDENPPRKVVRVRCSLLRGGLAGSRPNRIQHANCFVDARNVKHHAMVAADRKPGIPLVGEPNFRARLLGPVELSILDSGTTALTLSDSTYSRPQGGWELYIKVHYVRQKVEST